MKIQDECSQNDTGGTTFLLPDIQKPGEMIDMSVLEEKMIYVEEDAIQIATHVDHDHKN